MENIHIKHAVDSSVNMTGAWAGVSKDDLNHFSASIGTQSANKYEAKKSAKELLCVMSQNLNLLHPMIDLQSAPEEIHRLQGAVRLTYQFRCTLKTVDNDV